MPHVACVWEIFHIIPLSFHDSIFDKVISRWGHPSISECVHTEILWRVANQSGEGTHNSQRLPFKKIKNSVWVARSPHLAAVGREEAAVKVRSPAMLSRLRGLLARPAAARLVQASARSLGRRLCSTAAVPAGASAPSAAPLASASGAAPPQVGWWLLGCSGAVFGMVVLGGVTRLTRSGLSMTEWRPQGSWPPSTPEEWETEFGKYKQFPEFQARLHYHAPASSRSRHSAPLAHAYAS